MDPLVSKMFSFKFYRVFSALFAVLLCTSVQANAVNQGMRNAMGIAFLAINDMINRFEAGGIHATNSMCDLDRVVEDVVAAEVRFQ